MCFIRIGVLPLYDMGYLYKKALYGAYITSRLGIKKFHWVINTALEHWRPRSINRSTNTDFYTFLFLKFGIFSIGRTQDHTTRNGARTTLCKSKLAGFDWEIRRLDDTLPCFLGRWALMLSAIFCLRDLQRSKLECHLSSSVSPLKAWQDELSIAIKHHHVSPTTWRDRVSKLNSHSYIIRLCTRDHSHSHAHSHDFNL